MIQIYGNNMDTLLSSSISDTDGIIQVDDPGLMPSPDTVRNEFFLLTLTDGNVSEIVKVTDKDGGTNDLTISRAQEGTTAQSWPAGTQVIGAVTAGTMKEATSPGFSSGKPFFFESLPFDMTGTTGVKLSVSMSDPERFPSALSNSGTETLYVPTEFGVIITDADTVTADPSVSLSGGAETNNFPGGDYIASQTVPNVGGTHHMTRFTEPDFQYHYPATLLEASLAAAGTATTLQGKFYVKGYYYNATHWNVQV